MAKRQVNTTFLNNGWTFTKGFEPSYLNTFPEGEAVRIPHTVKELPRNHFSEWEYQFISSYKTTFDVTKKRQKRYILWFDGVMAYCEVYLNKQQVTTHKGGYTPFFIDVTKALKSGANELVVMVDSNERDDIPPFGHVVDFLTYGGIYRDVYLEEQPLNYITHALIHVEDDELNVRLLLDVQKAEDTVFAFNIYKDDQLAYFFEREYDLRKTDILVKEKVYLDPWTLDEPNLYELEIRIGEETIYRSRFANRQVAFTTNGFFLNKEPVKLIGLNRHQSYPYVGYAMPASMQRHDADFLKFELGVNIVRSSHYPPSRHFLDRCDEIGLLVFDEIPGWQHIGPDAWKQVAIADTKAMVLRDYNHPSVVIWGVRINESPDDDAFYTETNRIARHYDTSRPTGGVRNFAGSHLLEDVYTYNDFVHRGDNIALETPKKITKKSVPYLVTEFNGHMFPTKSFDDEAHRIDHVMRHLNVQDANFANPAISGAIGWCLADYNTHKDFGSGDRICYHGVTDLFRIPKDAAYVYASQGTTEPFLHIASALQIGDRAASEIKEVMLLTNVDYVKFYINDDYIGTYYPAHDRFPHLPHPPIVVDDFIGRLIHENEPFNEKDATTVKTILLHIMKHGMKLPLLLKLKMGWVLFKHRMSVDQAAKLYERYVGKWGLESLTYRFEGYVDELPVVVQTAGPSHEGHLRIEPDRTTLHEATTYDVTRIVVAHVDHHDHVRRYANDVLRLKTKGAISLIGPSHVALVGGVTGIYVKTVGSTGKGELVIESDRLGKHTVHFTVE
jgi:beta-galactosidase